MKKPFITLHSSKQLILHVPYNMIWCHEHSAKPAPHFADKLNSEGYDVSGYCSQYIIYPGEYNATYYIAFTINDYNYKSHDLEILLEKTIQISKSL